MQIKFIDPDAAHSDLLETVRQRESLRAALREARLYVDGTLGPERPVAVAEIDRALEGASDKSDRLDKSEKGGDHED